MNRDDFIKFIPKPTNEDVILYDISLKELIDVDVLTEYNKLFPVFQKTKMEFMKLKEEIDIYTETINQIFLVNPSWSEEMYLEKLREDMQLYSTLYGDIKRKEDKIKILQKKIDSTNEKIIIQKNKEEKENEAKNINLNQEIEENKVNLIKFKDTIDVYKNSLKRIDEQIRNIKSDLKILKESESQLVEGTYRCFCCGRKIKENETEKIINKITINIQKNTEQLNLLLEQKEKNQNTLNYYKDEISKIKNELQNSMNFKKNLKNMYIKKSIEILKLEASRNEYLNKIEEEKQNLENEPKTNSKKFLELKNRIQKYRISLDNLKKIKSMKGTTALKIKVYEERKIKLKKMQTLLTKYLTFLNIYYKIYEQKASQYAGPDYKIKFFEIKNYEIINTLIITYKGIEYSELSKKDKQTVDKNLAEKFLSDF